MTISLMVLLAVFVLAQMVRATLADRAVVAERQEWARERAELLNRLQRPDVLPFVPPVVKPIPPRPRPGDQDPEPEGWEMVGQDVTLSAD